MLQTCDATRQATEKQRGQTRSKVGCTAPPLLVPHVLRTEVEVVSGRDRRAAGCTSKHWQRSPYKVNIFQKKTKFDPSTEIVVTTDAMS